MFRSSKLNLNAFSKIKDTKKEEIYFSKVIKTTLVFLKENEIIPLKINIDLRIENFNANTKNKILFDEVLNSLKLFWQDIENYYNLEYGNIKAAYELDKNTIFEYDNLRKIIFR